MSQPIKPSLLASLREKSEVLRAQDTAARKPMEEALKDIDRGLWRTFRWLDEAIGHLQVIKPAVMHTFVLDKILSIAHPHFDRGFVSFRRRALAGMEVLEHVEMFYRLEGFAPIAVRVSPAAALGIEQRLRGSTLDFTYQAEQDEMRVVRYGLFQIQPAISASVRFQPDYYRQVVLVTLHNVDRFESVQLEFVPDKLDEPALEDLVRFIMGEPNGFLRRAPLAHIRARRDAAPESAAIAPQRVRV